LLAWATDQYRERVLVVIDGDSDPLVDMLAPVALVVVEDTGGPVAQAFRVRSVPAFCVLGTGGQVRAVARQVARLPIAAQA
jgi:hypothetical protein